MSDCGKLMMCDCHYQSTIARIAKTLRSLFPSLQCVDLSLETSLKQQPETESRRSHIDHFVPVMS